MRRLLEVEAGAAELTELSPAAQVAVDVTVDTQNDKLGEATLNLVVA